ncbi:acyloxyacyl hydrolase [Rhodospirillaceae bacterium KN72]|uniref:Acyloxyacyl hydrolase n=1 Tax=Pacificispira spongiicola TaxID=2729598 RepID=A0A7Y0DXT9_9PROT|nr:acyloxyacyl hydrolase [Pacificispira spongiicola]NMM43560.1 acyloxyacyl hydrolase [Pacificispira spongiicola]
MRFLKRGFALISFLAMASGPALAEEAGSDPAFLRIGGGYYDTNDDMGAGEFHMEYISGSKWWVFNPFVGLMTTTDSALYAYAGIRLDLFIGNRLVITPSFAPGLYHDGDGKDLGYPVEFRSAIEFAYRFDDRSRLGVSYYHLSNASLDENNPGTEVAILHYSYPFKRLFGD